MLGGIITILGGILAASGFIISKKPNAQELIDKITPYQGWIGIVLFGWGVYWLFGALTNLNLISVSLVFWVFWLVSALANLLVGFLLGFGLISKYALSKNEAAEKKGQEIRAKLVKIQVPIGFLAIIMGVLYILWPYLV